MRVRTVLGEAWRNLVSGTVGAAVGFVVLTVLTGVLALADLLTIGQLQTQAGQWVAAGAATRGMQAAHGIDGQACDALSGVSTIQASGALADGPNLRFLAMPTVAIQTYQATPGFAGVVGIRHPLAGGVWIDQGLADIMGARVGDRLDTTDGLLLVGGIFDWPQDGRDQRLSFSVLIPRTPTGTFDECWYQAWPAVDANDILLRDTQTILTTAPAQVGQVNTSLGTSLDANSLFTARLTRWVPVACLAAGLGLGYTMARRRRLEYASNLHAGQAKPAQLAGCALETLAWAIPAALVAIVVAWAVATRLTMADIPHLLAITGRGPLLGLVGTVLGALIACAQTREKHLFRLFKTR